MCLILSVLLYSQEKSVFGDSIAGGEEEAKQCEVTFQTLDDARVRNAREVRGSVVGVRAHALNRN